MDAFITVVKTEKREDDITSLHEHREARLRELVSSGRNVLVCGGVGVGKTFVIERALDETSIVRLEPEHLKAKHSLVEFLGKTDKTLVIEDYAGEAFYKTLIERVADGERLTRGGLVVTSQDYHLWGSNFEVIHIEPHEPDALMRLLPDRVAAVKCRGNVRDFFSYARNRSDDKDVFKTPKELVFDMLSTGEYPDRLESVVEHGHMFSIVQENYLDSRDANHTRIAHSFSDADVFDNSMYHTGDWNLMPYFIHGALEMPVRNLGEPIKADVIRSGSFWTKDGNARMRRQRLRQIEMAVAPASLDLQGLHLLHTYASLKMYDRLCHYNIRAPMFDVMNHLRIGAQNKLKQKDVSMVKKALKQHGLDKQ